MTDDTGADTAPSVTSEEGAAAAIDVDALFAAALDVQGRAYAPYSNFYVGAAILAASGRIYACCNVENAAYPSAVCAEAGAISAMVAAGDREIVAVLTICDGDQVGTCCGNCRQRIREFAGGDTPIFACGPEGVRATFTLDGFLPMSFGPDNLGVVTGSGGDR